MASGTIPWPGGFKIIQTETTCTIANGFSSNPLDLPDGFTINVDAWLITGYARSTTINTQGAVSDTGALRVINSGSSWTGTVVGFWICKVL